MPLPPPLWMGPPLPEDWPTVAPSGPFATIVKRYGTPFSYRLTPRDVYWAAKMAAFEGDAAEVLWAMTQRFVATYRGQQWDSFTEFIRAYSQPISPAWYRDGAHCRPGGRNANAPQCAEELLDRRDEIREMSWEELKQVKGHAVDTALRWARGELRNPVPRAVHFAHPRVSRKWLTQCDGELVRQAGNWFLATDYSRNWPADYVVMRSPSGTVAAIDQSPLRNATRVFVRNIVHPVSFQRRA